MSWNRASYPKRPQKKKPSAGRGLLAGGIVVVLGVAALCVLLSGREDEPKKPAPAESKSARTATAKPARPSAKRAAEEAPPKPLKPQRVGEIRDGKMLMVDGRLRKVSKHVITAEVARVTIADKTFDEPTDRLLAHILEMEPGEALVGDSADLYKGFDKAFVKSLDTPIVYDKDDDQYVKELKAGVQALRDELKARMAAGEDINKVLAETRDQFQELGAYRQDLENMVIEMTQEKGLSQEAYDDIVKAANKMLEERGSKPLELPTAVRHRFKIYNATRNKDNNEEQAK